MSVKETLSRHRTILENFCKAKKLHVAEVLEEVVSGESLYARPEMMRLLDMINTGMYAGVVCMDIERLSRGSSLESGHIMQVLQVNSCKIITPGKTYDLQNDSDEQFTDMKFMFSRYELKTINKRLVRGRNQSASEGKFMGSMAPYGYRAFKLPGEPIQLSYNDPEAIAALLECAIPENYVPNSFLKPSLSNCRLNVTITLDDYGNQKVENYVIPSGKVPQFILDDADKAAGVENYYLSK